MKYKKLWSAHVCETKNTNVDLNKKRIEASPFRVVRAMENAQTFFETYGFRKRFLRSKLSTRVGHRIVLK